MAQGLDLIYHRPNTKENQQKVLRLQDNQLDQSSQQSIAQGKATNQSPFCDDIALLAASASRLKGLTKSLIETSKKMGMEISAEKSNVVVVGATSERIDENVEVGGAPLEQVQQFKYLGCTIHENGKSTAEVRIRTGIKWTDRRTNELVRQQVANMAGSVQHGLLEMAKERKLRLFVHVSRHPGDLELATPSCMAVLLGTMLKESRKGNG
eukprot:gene14458-biopygen11563